MDFLIHLVISILLLHHSRSDIIFFNSFKNTIFCKRLYRLAIESFKGNSYCVGGGQYASTLTKEGDLTETGQNLFVGKCVNFNRKKSMTVKDITLEAEGLGNFFYNFRKISC